MKKLFIIFVVISMSFACQNTASDAQKQYEQNLQTVLDGHDELMKDMSKVSHLIQQLENPNSPANEEKIPVATEDLKSANQAMFDWMHDFNEDFPDLYEKDKVLTKTDYEERIRLLKKHEKTLEEMKNHFEKSIKNAENLLVNPE